jgi:hypothetical protein
MKKFVVLSLCLSLSIFVLARTMKTSHTLASVAKTAQETSTEQKGDANTLVSAEEEVVAAEEDTDEGVALNDDDSMEDASADEGEDMSGDDSGDDEGDADTGDGDGGDDDGEDDGGDDGSS